MLENDELTIQARVSKWYLFSPNWNFIRQIPAVPLGSLCGLSIGLAPMFADPNWVINVAMPHLNGTDTDEVFEAGLDDAHVNKYQTGLLSKFIERAHVATANLEPLGTLQPAVGFADSTKTLVRVVDFIRWATVKGWSMPHELVEQLQRVIEPPASLPAMNESSSIDTGQVGEFQTAAEPLQARTEKKAEPLTIALIRQTVHDEIASWFDGVGYEQLASMFKESSDPKENERVWKSYAAEASKNGLREAAKVKRSKFNPYKAGLWWLDRKRPTDWTQAKMDRTLANNLPARSLEHKPKLTGDDYK